MHIDSVRIFRILLNFLRKLIELFVNDLQRSSVADFEVAYESSINVNNK